jgi:hypothetical protein
MPINNNEFYKGDNRDLDVLKMPNDTARRIRNMRILDVDGKGLVLTNIGGTEEVFNLTRGFIPVGKCEYNGVGYIASVNPQTGEGELGVYPAPRALVEQDCNFSGWDQANKEYAPLFNFTGGNPARDPNSISQAFRTQLFEFDCEKQIDMFAREDYDGSVGLYLAQLDNPIRVYNSGFDQDGNCTSIGRRYSNTSFPNAVNLLHESECHMDVEFLGLGAAGIHRAGNWFYFFRYATENFDKTSFNAETNAIQITTGTYNVEGISHHGFTGGEETDKSVNLRLSNLDPTYSYIEIGYMYSFSGDQEFGIIDKLYKLEPNQTTIDIEITGYETSFVTSLADIIKTKPQYDGALTHTQLENRYFAGNLFDTANYDDNAIDSLLEFSRNITCQYDDSHLIQHKNGPLYLGVYNNEFNVYNYTGHFRAEAYAYAVVFVLNNGRETQAFPVTGSDDFNGLGGVTNNNGVYRFPTSIVSPPETTSYVRVMGIKFDISTAIANLPTYVQENVAGFYFVRAERNETLMYQGVTLPCYNSESGEDLRQTTALFGDRPKKMKQNEDVVPMFDDEDDGAYFPYIHRFDPDPVEAVEYTFVGPRENLTGRVSDKWGMYSPDHFFNKTLDVTKSYVYPIGRVNFSFTGITGYSKEEHYYENYSINYTLGIPFFGDVSNIKEWEPANNNGFTSYFNEGRETDFNSMYYFFIKTVGGGRFIEIRNHEIAWNSYVGLKAQRVMRFVLSNYYKTDITPSSGFDIADLYDIKSTDYFKISKFYKLSEVIQGPNIINDKVHYKGDCFVQRTWLKQLFNPKYGPSVKDDGGGILGSEFSGSIPFTLDAKSFSFGVLFNIITENKINTEMRLDNFTNKFFPGSTQDPKDFSVKNTEKESTDLNRGYNQVLSIKSYKGIDEDIPFFPENKPAGIMYSNKHVLGSFLDGYREIDLAALNEYDYRLGEIKSLQVLNNLLISIQRQGINRHFVNEKAVLNQGNSAGELLLGTGGILDPKHHNLTDFVGTQNQWSIISTDVSIYGVDYNKRKIWRLLPNLQVDLISDTKGYREELHNLCEVENTDSDVTEQFLDNPVCRQGIVAHYDRKHNDVYFTWVYGNPVQNEDCSINRNTKTIVFNEWLDAFHGDRGFGSPMYMNINEDFFSWNPNIFPSTNPGLNTGGDAWIHDIFEIDGDDNSTSFYGEDADISFVEFIVKEPSDITKVFDNLEISSSPDDLYKAVFETQHQETEHFPWIEGGAENYWRDPVYTENLWKLSIIRTQQTQEPTNNIYDVDSRFRGRWIKIRLEWKTKSRIFIKSVLTHYRQSHN